MTTSPKDSAASRDWSATDISIFNEMSAGPSPTDIAISDHLCDGYAPLAGLAPGSTEAQERQRDAVEKTGYPQKQFLCAMARGTSRRGGLCVLLRLVLMDSMVLFIEMVG